MKALTLCTLCIIVTPLLSAENITLTSSLTAEVTPTVLRAKLLIKNDGEAAAYNVQARFHTDEKQWLSKVYPRLDMGQELTIEYIEKLELAKKGIYPLAVKIHFKDAGGYPMTTVIVNPFTYGEMTNTAVYGRLEKLVLSNRGELGLFITNTGYKNLNLDINIFVPDEISALQTRTQLVLEERSKVDHRFTLKNFSALAGAIYPVWATIEYERDNKHFTSVCSGEIEVIRSENIFKKYWWLWLILAGTIVVLIIWLNLNIQSKRLAGQKNKEESS